MNAFSGTSILRKLITQLTSLVRLTEEDRIQAGIFLGHIEKGSYTEPDIFTDTTAEESNIRASQDR